MTEWIKSGDIWKAIRAYDGAASVAEIAAHICPAHENDFFACVRFCEVRAVVGSFPTAQ